MPVIDGLSGLRTTKRDSETYTSETKKPKYRMASTVGTTTENSEQPVHLGQALANVQGGNRPPRFEIMIHFG